MSAEEEDGEGGGEEDEDGRTAGRGSKKNILGPRHWPVGLLARLAPKASLACSCRCRAILGNPITSPPTLSQNLRCKSSRRIWWRSQGVFIRFAPSCPAFLG